MKFFSNALALAGRAARESEVPIGAVLVKDGKIVAKAYNQTEKKGRFTVHAEMLCIERATRKLRTKYLNGCELYVTLEPCRMCRTAAELSRIEQIYFLLKSPKFGRHGKAHFKTQVRLAKSPLTQRAKELLQAFFQEKR